MKKSGVTLIDINALSLKLSPKSLCLPEPDGVHLSKFGAEIYAKIIFSLVN